jgi:MATE family multidrug resistance protein
MIKNLWFRQGGYAEVLRTAFPLILSTSAWTLQQFVDRMFLTWYSPSAIAASMPAGILNFTFVSLFFGTVSYVTTFVAQYHGAGISERIGPVIWQSVYLSFVGGVLIALLIPFASPVFRLIGHSPEVQAEETVYFRILCAGSFFPILNGALSGFFSGRGKMWPLLWANLAGTAVNIVLDYGMIFGNLGFREMGIAGAGIATVLSGFAGTLFYVVAMAKNRANVEKYSLGRSRVDLGLTGRLLRYGSPNGVQFFLDIVGFSAFLLIVGRLGTSSLAATNIAFNINTLAFMPMIGFAMAVSILVGQYIGEGKPDLAERSVYSCFAMTFLYMAAVASLYVLVPELFLRPYRLLPAQGASGEAHAIGRTVVVLLRFVAFYSIFDTLNLVFASAVKGAGDTHFVMYTGSAITFSVLVAPSYVFLVLLGRDIYTGWFIAAAYVCIMGVSFLLRFLQGKWKAMKVIEERAG